MVSMQSSIHHSQTINTTTIDATAGTKAALQTTHRGEQITLSPSAQSLINNASEELGSLRSEKRMLRLTERRFSNQRGNKVYGNSFLDAIDDVNEKAAEFTKQLFINKPSDSANLFNLLRSSFEQVENQSAALWYAFEEFQTRKRLSKKDQNFLELMGETLLSLDKGYEQAIRSSINISQAARQESSESVSSETLKQSYYDAVLDYGGISETFSKLYQKYGDNQLSLHIRFLYLALAADLAAIRPSAEKLKLRAIINDIYILQSIWGIHTECCSFVDNYARTFDEKPFSSFNIVADILALVEGHRTSPDRINQLLHNYQINEEQQQIFFLTSFSALVRLAPIKAFKESFQRDVLLDNIQLCLDDFINKEENEIVKPHN